MRKGVFGPATVLLACLASTSAAQPAFFAYEGATTGSWNRQVAYSGFSDHDVLEFFITNDVGGAGPFELAPAIGDPLWSSQLINSGYVMASGPNVVSGRGGYGGGGASDNLVRHFYDGNPTGTISVDWLFWSGGGYGVGTLVDAARLTYSSTGAFSATFFDPASVNVDGYNRSSNVIPEPTTLALIGTGLLAFARKRRRKSSDSIQNS